MLARKLFFLLMVVFFSSTYSHDTFAAIPIKERQQASQKLVRKINDASAVQISRSLQQTDTLPAEEQESKPDSGINGSLAFAFGLLGIFPVAIILGIIGMQPHRRDRGLAIAGLVLGFLGMLYFIAALILLFTIL